MVGELYLRNGLPITGPVQRVGAQDTALAPDRTMTQRFNKDWDDVSTNWEPELTNDIMTGNANYSEFTGPDGDTWCRLLFQEGTVANEGTPKHKKSLRVDIDATGYNRAYFGFKVRFGDGFGYVLGGKLPGMWAGTTFSSSGGSGSMTSDTGLIAATWRHMWRGTGAGTDDELMTYCYDRERYDDVGAGNSGENWNPTRLIRPGKVQHIEQVIDLGTPGNTDGLLQMWLDGILIAEQTNRKFLDAAATIKIEGFWCDIFWGGSSASWRTERDETIEFGRCIFEAD